jgi:hypothetical protein
LARFVKEHCSIEVSLRRGAAMTATSDTSMSGTTELAVLKERAGRALQQRRFDIAAGLYRRLAEAEPHDGSHSQKLGDAFIRLGCRRAAVEAYRAAAHSFYGANDLTRAVSALHLVVALEPTDKLSKERLSALRRLQQHTSAEVAPRHDTAWGGEQISRDVVLSLKESPLPPMAPSATEPRKR